MGVPKFFRYMSERYPCLSELVREDQIPQFDNLYLDMNGIIHPCSHPDDGNVQFRISEEAIFRAIFSYIDKLFFLIKPQKLFFMAVDGVAPRAKMNQQRSRRFRSAKDAETLEMNAINRGEKLPETARFDSNCITPGTEFMVRLQNALKYFVKLKMSSNPLWQRCRIILSGHETPGEGEHKIMEYIRYLKSQPGYDTNTRHCLYGLDADLIVLGLCTHEMHFSLLREEVSFGKKAKKASIEETRFFLLHLNLLREYLELEFGSLRSVEGKEFNMFRIIDDWILMGFLVGNDFIPPLPNFHINSNAFPMIYGVYKSVWPEIDGYLNENGKLNLINLEKFMEKLAEKDLDMFRDMSADLKYLEGKRNNNGESEIPEAFDFNVSDMEEGEMNLDLAKLIAESNELYGSDDDLSDEDALLEKEFEQHKRNYYITKMNYAEMTPEVLAEQTECYIEALQWILLYYYRGVSSWGWFYPHHYAPFASDLKNFNDLQFNFKLGNPFLPFEQLLAVLPAASKELLPEAFRDLMTNPESEIIEYYPKDFKTDLNGKKQEWEAVVLIPFIDEEKLLKAMEQRFPQLLTEEKDRNIHGPMLQFDYTEKSQGECPGVFSFKKLAHVHCAETEVWRDQVRVPADYLESLISKWPEKPCHLPGFPTMKYLKYTGELQRARVKVFEQPSRNDTMVLLPEVKKFDELESVAAEHLDQIVYIGWPHLVKSKVNAVLTREHKISANGIEDIHPKLFDVHLNSIEEHVFHRMGIKFRETNAIVLAKTLVNIEYVVGSKCKMIPSHIWSNTEVAYPLQGLVKNIRKDNDFPEFKIEDFYPVGTPIFLLSSPYFGCEGKILDPKLVYNCGRIQVNITVIPEPQLVEAKQVQADVEQRYYNTYELSMRSGIESNILARITGSILIIHGDVRGDLVENTPKTNIGLNLKSKKTDHQVAGYVRKQGNTWLYSQKTIDLIIAYREEFPEVFDLLLSKSGGRDEFFETVLFPPGNTERKLSDITTWIKQQDHYKQDRIPCGTKWVESEAVDCIKKAVEDLKLQPVKCIKLQVKPHLLLKHGFDVPQAFRSKSSIRLFDRVVVAKKTYEVPVGYKGTVIAIHPLVDPNPVRIECVKQVETFVEVLFDQELPSIGDENDAERKRIARVAHTSLIIVYQPLEEHVSVAIESMIQGTNKHESLRATNIKPNHQKEFNSTVQSTVAATSSRQPASDRNMSFFLEPPKNESSPNQQNISSDSRNVANSKYYSHDANISTFFKPPSTAPTFFAKPSSQPTIFFKNNAAPKHARRVDQWNRNGQNTDARAQGSQLMNRTGEDIGPRSKTLQKIDIAPPQIIKENIKNASTKPEVLKDPVDSLSKGIRELGMQNLPSVNESTEILRKLLGVGSSNLNMKNKDEQPKKPIEPMVNPVQANPFERHKSNAINFPKPPPNWTKSDPSDQLKGRRCVNTFVQPPAPLFNMPQPPFPQFNYVQPIQPYRNQNYNRQMPLHVDMRYATHPTNVSNSSKCDKMSPSPETRISNISTGPSAFIPLQAMKSARKTEPQKSISEANSKPVNRTSQIPVEKNTPTTSLLSLLQQEKTETSEADKTTEPPITKPAPAPPKIRKPRIAANFNFKG